MTISHNIEKAKPQYKASTKATSQSNNISKVTSEILPKPRKFNILDLIGKEEGFTSQLKWALICEMQQA